MMNKDDQTSNYNSNRVDPNATTIEGVNSNVYQNFPQGDYNNSYNQFDSQGVNNSFPNYNPLESTGLNDYTYNTNFTNGYSNSYGDDYTNMSNMNDLPYQNGYDGQFAGQYGETYTNQFNEQMNDQQMYYDQQAAGGYPDYGMDQNYQQGYSDYGVPMGGTQYDGNSEKSEPKENKSKTVLLLVIIILLLLVIIGGIIYYFVFSDKSDAKKGENSKESITATIEPASNESYSSNDDTLDDGAISGNDDIANADDSDSFDQSLYDDELYDALFSTPDLSGNSESDFNPENIESSSDKCAFCHETKECTLQTFYCDFGETEYEGYLCSSCATDNSKYIMAYCDCEYCYKEAVLYKYLCEFEGDSEYSFLCDSCYYETRGWFEILGGKLERVTK